jgi:hypothetical protein
MVSAYIWQNRRCTAPDLRGLPEGIRYSITSWDAPKRERTQWKRRSLKSIVNRARLSRSLAREGSVRARRCGGSWAAPRRGTLPRCPPGYIAASSRFVDRFVALAGLGQRPHAVRSDGVAVLPLPAYQTATPEGGALTSSNSCGLVSLGGTEFGSAASAMGPMIDGCPSGHGPRVARCRRDDHRAASVLE